MNRGQQLGAHAADLADFLAVVGRNQLDGAAHFVEARADALADAVGERFFARDCNGLTRRQPRGLG